MYIRPQPLQGEATGSTGSLFVLVGGVVAAWLLWDFFKPRRGASESEQAAARRIGLGRKLCSECGRAVGSDSEQTRDAMNRLAGGRGVVQQHTRTCSQHPLNWR